MLRLFRPLLSLSFVVAATSAVAQQTPALSPPPVDSFFPVELKAGKVTLPGNRVEVPLDVSGNRPTVLITINGRGPFRFGIETGAPVITIGAKAAQEIGYPAIERSQWIQLDSLHIGAAKFYNIHAKIFARRASQPLAEAGVDGLLGLNVYYDLLLTIDPAKHIVQFTRDTLPPVDHRTVFAIKPLGSQWYTFESWVNGEPGFAFLDTQDPGKFRVTPSQVADSQFVTPPVVSGILQGPSLGTQTTRAGRFKGDIRVGGVVYQHPIAQIVPIPSEFLQRWIVGWGVLQHFTLALDQRTRRIQLTSTDSIVAPPASLYSADMSFDATNFGIGAVKPDGAAAQQGLQVGDIIVSFNDVQLTREKFDEFCSLLEKPAPIRLAIRRGGELHTIVLTPRVLVI